MFLFAGNKKYIMIKKKRIINIILKIIFYNVFLLGPPQSPEVEPQTRDLNYNTDTCWFGSSNQKNEAMKLTFECKTQVRLVQASVEVKKSKTTWHYVKTMSFMLKWP